MHLPWLKRKFAKKAVSELCVYDQGITLVHCHEQQEKTLALTYQKIRRVWFERFQTGSEAAGHTAFRIDVIAENLDTLFTLTKVDCSPEDEDLLLMERLYLNWKLAVWRHYQVVAAVVMAAGPAPGPVISTMHPTMIIGGRPVASMVCIVQGIMPPGIPTPGPISMSIMPNLIV